MPPVKVSSRARCISDARAGTRHLEFLKDHNIMMKIHGETLFPHLCVRASLHHGQDTEVANDDISSWYVFGRELIISENTRLPFCSLHSTISSLSCQKLFDSTASSSADQKICPGLFSIYYTLQLTPPSEVQSY
jgi:hypothetical protein